MAPPLLLALVLGCSQVAEPPAAPTHTVARGETLGVIADRHGVSVEDLVRWNALPSADRIEVGQVLVLAGDVGTPPPPTTPKRRRKRVGGTVQAPAPAPGSEPSGAPALVLPAAQPCLPPPDLHDEEGMVASAGLSEDQVRSAMSRFVGNTLRCVPPGWTSDGTLTVTVEVACTGRVATVTVIDPGSFPADMVSCVADVLRYAGFPSHDTETGFAFDYPLRFAFSGS